MTGVRWFGILFLISIGLTLAFSQRGTLGVVSGQLRGTNGSPAAGVRVSATTVPTASAPDVALVSIAQTDRDGRFRLENLPAGRYFIQAGFIDTPTYFPGVVSVESATPVVVAAGAGVSGIDFTARQSTGVRISGRIPPGLTPAPTTIRMTSAAVSSSGAIGTIGPAGTFEFLRIGPGTYTLSLNPSNAVLPSIQLVVNDRDVMVGLPAGPAFRIRGTVGLGSASVRPAGQRVVLSAASPWGQLETVAGPAGEFEFPSVPAGEYAVRTAPGSFLSVAKLVVVDRDIPAFVVPASVELNGRVVLEDGSALAPASLALMIQADGAIGLPIATVPAIDGSFKLPLIEGEHRITVNNVPAGLALKSATYGAVDLVAGTLKLDGRAAPEAIHIVLARVR